MSAFGEPERRTDRCRECHAAIWWGLTLKGRRMPLDVVAVEDGNVVMDRLEQAMDQLAGADESGPGQALPHVRVLRAGEAVGDDVVRYRSHFATCPAAARFRQRDREKRKRSRAKARAMGIEGQR